MCGTGLYARQLQRWRSAWPRKQMLILNFEFLTAHSQQAMVILGEFTGLPQGHPWCTPTPCTFH